MTAPDRSIWAWGLASRFPDRDTRRDFGKMAGAMLGFEPTALLDPPAVDSLELAESRVSAPSALADCCSTSIRDRAAHAYGKGYPDILRGLRGDYARTPDCVALPTSEQQLVDLLDWCNQAGISIVPYGGGSSVVGGVDAPEADAVVSIDLQGLDRVLEVREQSLAARIQAGASGPLLNGQLAEHGLQLRHFPQSYEYSTLGGWIATRAGGHYATLYTHIDDFVESLRLLTPRGVVETRRLPGSGAGPDANRLIIGSEGTLGIISEAWVRVQRRPRWRATATLEFSSFDGGVEAVRALTQSGLYPTNCRLLEAREAMLNGVPTGGAAVLIVGFESADHPLEAPMQRALAIAEQAGGTCPKGPRYRESSDTAGDSTASAWRQAFFDAPYQRDVLVSLGVIVDTFETACTWDDFPALHAGVVEAVEATMRRECGGGIVTCRLTHAYPDGPAPYFTFIAPGRDGAELQQWRAIKVAASDALLAHGGTITHHHAVGRLHRPWYEREQPEMVRDALRAVKAEWDPNGVLNAGVLFG